MLDQLRQRNVHRVALAYLAGAWLIIQIVDTLTPEILPAIVFRATVTIAAVGFVPALILSWVFEWTPEGLKREGLASTGMLARDSRWLDRVIMITLVIAVSYFAVDKFVFDPVRDRKEIAVATAEAVEDALTGRLLQKYADRSILVLPFLNISSDPDQEYFADGVSEELLNLLARIEELRVISRSTSWTFKGKDIDVARIRDRLGVSHILEGSVRKSGNQIRITAQLIDASTDRHLWSATYDRMLDDIFAIQDEISARVVDRLKIELLAAPPTAENINPMAYDLYLRGRHLTHTVDRTDGEKVKVAFDEAVELLSLAVELAPDYVPAVWELARVTRASAALDSLDARAKKEERVRALVDRLVELAPDSSYANGFLAARAEREGDLQAAALYRERAVIGAVDSNRYVQLGATARFLYDLGRVDEAAMLALYIVNHDPAGAPHVMLLARIFRQTDRHRELADHLESLLEWWEGTPLIHWHLGVAWLVASEPGKALEWFKKSSSYNRPLGRLLALHDLGRDEEFDAEFAAMLEDPDQHPEAIARIAAWTGRHDLAFEYLERAVKREGPWFVRPIKSEDDLYGPIMADPRWRDFLDRYDKSSEVDRSNIRFNPKLPAEVVAALAAKRQAR